MDYFFMSAEEEKASANVIIVMVDESTGCVYARGVGRKGVEGVDWSIEDKAIELRCWGIPEAPILS